MSGDELCCTVAQFNALLNITLDIPGPTVSLGCVELTAVAGTARLHTNKEVFTLYICIFTWYLYIGIAPAMAGDCSIFGFGHRYLPVPADLKVHLVL